MSLTVGQDAYWTVADVITFWQRRHVRTHTAWTALTTATAEALVRRATDYIDRTFDFRGEKATKAQRLKWPRRRARVEGYTLALTEIPWQIQEATALIADELRAGNFDDKGIVSKDAAVKRQKVDVIEIEYDTVRRVRLGGDIATHVTHLLRPLLASHSALLRA